jgi:hypothetical protein
VIPQGFLESNMRILPMLVLTALLAAPAFAQAQAPAQAVYPAKSQSPEQQAKDEAECQQWAINKSGFDPAHPPVPAQAQAAPVTGSGARARGAVGGAVIAGATGGDVGQGAAAGAVVGGVVRRNKNRAAAAQANETAEQQVQAGQTAFANARAACLQGRGYSVK